MMASFGNPENPDRDRASGISYTELNDWPVLERRRPNETNSPVDSLDRTVVPPPPSTVPSLEAARIARTISDNIAATKEAARNTWRDWLESAGLARKKAVVVKEEELRYRDSADSRRPKSIRVTYGSRPGESLIAAVQKAVEVFPQDLVPMPNSVNGKYSLSSTIIPPPNEEPIELAVEGEDYEVVKRQSTPPPLPAAARRGYRPLAAKAVTGEDDKDKVWELSEKDIEEYVEERPTPPPLPAEARGGYRPSAAEAVTGEEFPPLLQPDDVKRSLDKVTLPWKSLAQMETRMFAEDNTKKWLVLAKGIGTVGGPANYTRGDDRFELMMKFNLSKFCRFDVIAECLFNKILNGTAHEKDLRFDRLNILDLLDKWVVTYIGKLFVAEVDLQQIDMDLARIFHDLIEVGIYNDAVEIRNRFNDPNKFRSEVREYVRVLTSPQARPATQIGGIVVRPQTKEEDHLLNSLKLLLDECEKTAIDGKTCASFLNLAGIEQHLKRLDEITVEVDRIAKAHDGDEDVGNQARKILARMHDICLDLSTKKQEVEAKLEQKRIESFWHFDVEAGETVDTPRPYKYAVLKVKGRTKVLFPGVISIGNDIVNIIELKRATDKHALLYLHNNGEWWIKEVNTNQGRMPIKVDQELLMRPMPLPNGKNIEIGSNVIKYERNHEFTALALREAVQDFIREYRELWAHREKATSEELEASNRTLDYLDKMGLWDGTLYTVESKKKE